jgi:hypothetical protein
MAHVSRPMQILLAATVTLLVFWVVALRPKPVAVENTPLAPTKAIPQANQAAAVSDAANAKLQAAATAADGSAPPAQLATAQQPATPAAKAQRVATAADGKKAGERRNAQVQRAVAQGKVVVLLFWNSKAADDIATRGALRDLDRRGGKVVVRVVPIADVASYTSVTQGVKIAQSPTTVIIGRNRATRVIAGLTEPSELAQAVGDALAGR